MAKPENSLNIPQGNGDIKTTTEGGKTVSNVQYFPAGIYANPADKTFATYELAEIRSLPKSLFYDAATSDGVGRGLFAYYVLGKGMDYTISERTQYLQKITPKVSKNPTAKRIIATVTGNGKIPNYLDPSSIYRGQVYNVKDFIFCKYYGIIPNNRMLTLRRFAYPTLDSLKVLANDQVGDFSIGTDGKAVYEKKSIQGLGIIQDTEARINTSLPVCQLVTYFGGDTGNNLNSIIGINTGLNYSAKTQSSLIEQNTGDPGLMNSPYGDLIKSAITSGEGNGLTDTNIDQMDKLIGTLTAPERQQSKLQRALLEQAVAADGPLSKKIFVNVNTVEKMVTRDQGFVGGIDQFTLTFHYNLSSAGEVNSRLLFLDLMTNILSMGADYGQFLAPEIRLNQTNLGMGFPGGPEGYAKSITDPMGYIKDLVSKMFSKGEVERQYNAEQTVSKEITDLANSVKNFVNDPSKGIDPNSKLYKSLSVMISDMFLKRVYYSPIMLSGYPIGEWHLTVGNPLNPIAMIGNLVCNGVKIAFNDELGPDDFPTEMTATISLMPGRQRHRGDYESFFNRGKGRLYLGQLVQSGESTKAWINTQGRFPNDTEGKDINDITEENISTITTGLVGATGGINPPTQ
jgi:hypothetical protein